MATRTKATTERPLLVGVAEAGAMLGVSESQVRILVKQGPQFGGLRHMTIGRRILVPVADLERYVAEQLDAQDSTILRVLDTPRLTAQTGGITRQAKPAR